MTAMTMIIKKDEMERLIEMEKIFNKNRDEDTFYLHGSVDQYMFMKVDEFIQQLTEFEKNTGEKITLYDCNIRTCKFSGRKYKRVTLTSEKHLDDLSKTEFCFGHMIAGWSYIFRPEKWSEIKKDIMTRVDYRTTPYGSATRRDLDGKQYKAKH